MRLTFLSILIASGWPMQRASASVVVVTPVHPVLAAAGEYDLTFELQNVDFNGDGLPEFQVISTPGGVALYISEPTQIFIVSSPSPNLGGSVANLEENVILGGNSENSLLRWFGGSIHLAHDLYPGILEKQVDLAITGTLGNLGNFNSRSGYFGIAFKLGTGTHYGWVRLSESEAYGVGGIITEWAYEIRPDTPIITGIPEPSYASLIGLGILIFTYRRTR